MRIGIVLTLIASCKGYDPDKLLALCSDGAGYDAMAAYTPAKPGAMAVVNKGPRTGGWYASAPTELPATMPSADTYQDIALALCIDKQPGAFDRDCDMDSFDTTMTLGGDAPKVDVHKSARGAATIKAYASRYVLTMRETKTGKAIATKTVEVPVTHCPIVVLGDNHEDYADIDDAVLAEFVTAARK
jgi:hypothetical protein